MPSQLTEPKCYQTVHIYHLRHEKSRFNLYEKISIDIIRTAKNMKDLVSEASLAYKER